MGALKEIRRKVELFFRGEFYLHLVTMFLIQCLLMEFFGLSVPSYLLPVFCGIIKEILDLKEGKGFSFSDVLGTVLGGYLYIILYSLSPNT